MFPGIKIWLLVEKEYDISKMFRSFFESAKVNLDLDIFQAVYKCWIIYEIQFSLLKFKRLKYYTWIPGPFFWRTAPRCRNIESNDRLMGEMANRTDREDETSGRSKESGVGPH